MHSLTVSFVAKMSPRILHQMLGHYLTLPLGGGGTFQTWAAWEEVRLLEACL